MIKKRRKRLIQFYVFSDIIAIILSFNLTYWLRFSSSLFSAPKGIPLYSKYLFIIPVLVLTQLIYFSYQGYYRIKLRRNRLDDLFLVFLNSVVSSFIIILIFSYLKSYKYIDFEISHTYLLTYVPLSVIFIFGFRSLIFRIFRKLFLKKNSTSRVLIAGTGDLALMMAENLRKYKHFGIEICGFLSPEQKEGVLGSYDDLIKVVKKYSITDLFIALPLKEYKTIMDLIETGNNLLIDIRLVPDILQIASLKAGMEHVEGIPIINLGDIPLQGWRFFLKRAFDFVFSLAGIIILIPFFIYMDLMTIVLK